MKTMSMTRKMAILNLICPYERQWKDEKQRWNAKKDSFCTMMLILRCLQVKALMRHSRFTAPTPKMKIWGLGWQARAAVVKEKRAQKKLSLLSSYLQALILLVKPKLTDSAIIFSSLLWILLLGIIVYSWSKMRKQKGIVMTHPSNRQQSAKFIRSLKLLKFDLAITKQRGRVEMVKQPTNYYRIEMAVFCQKIEMFTFASKKFINLQTVTVSTTEYRKRITDSAFISRKSEFKFIRDTLGLLMNLFLALRDRFNSIPMAFSTDELKLLNSICNTFYKKKGSSIAGKKQRHRIFQLFMSFRNRNNNPQRFTTVAKLETTTDKN